MKTKQQDGRRLDEAGAKPSDYANQRADIPLKIAMLAWNDADYGYCNGENKGKVIVIPWPDERRLCDLLKVSMTTGACMTAWHEWTKTQRLCNLFIEAWFIVCRDGVSPRDMHDALMVIPEYHLLNRCIRNVTRVARLKSGIHSSAISHIATYKHLPINSMIIMNTISQN
jgi:hypothetical protein